VGHDKPKPGGKGFTGGAVAAPIWERFMRPALAGEPAIDFPQPDTIIAAAIDPETGYLATADCPESQDEFFITGTEPTEYCPEHGGVPAEPLPADPLPPIEAGE
jgi:membrane carboxypeptidase/penicillin-binding protein